MFSQPHKYDTHGPTNLWQADSFIRSGKICNYGYPLEVSKSPIFGVQESKSTLDDSHVIAAKFQYFVCITRFFWCPRCPPKKYEKSSPVPFVPLISTRFRMVELIRLFTVVGVFTAVIWVEQSLEGFFQGHMERLEWNSQKFTTKETWHHSSWGHGRYKASNGICRSCKRTVSQIWKWMISKERLNIPIQRGFSMTDNENPSAWISTPEGVFFKRFGISHGMCDCGGLRLRYMHCGTIEFHFVGWLDISRAGSRRKSSAGVWLCLGANDDPASGEATDGKERSFTEFWIDFQIDLHRSLQRNCFTSGGSRFFCYRKALEWCVPYTVYPTKLGQHLRLLANILDQHRNIIILTAFLGVSTPQKAVKQPCHWDFGDQAIGVSQVRWMWSMRFV